MDRMINYQITENADGLRIEQFFVPIIFIKIKQDRTIAYQ